jgi:hypothetical protein
VLELLDAEGADTNVENGTAEVVETTVEVTMGEDGAEDAVADSPVIADASTVSEVRDPEPSAPEPTMSEPTPSEPTPSEPPSDYFGHEAAPSQAENPGLNGLADTHAQTPGDMLSVEAEI